MRIYAIGDIHGHLDKLRAAHERVAADRAACGDTAAQVVHIGDLVDRGPDSRGVIEHLLAGLARGAPWVVLKGNHDRMFECFLRGETDPGLRADYTWLHERIGGVETLASYGVEADPWQRPDRIRAEAQAAVPEAHRAFLAGLPTMHEAGEALFVHAGIRPGVKLAKQKETDLLWIRDPFLLDSRDHGPLVVHGHSPVEAATHYGNRINIDSGAAYGGPLSAIVLEGRAAFLLTDAGRVPLLPQTLP